MDHACDTDREIQSKKLVSSKTLAAIQHVCAARHADEHSSDGRLERHEARHIDWTFVATSIRRERESRGAISFTGEWLPLQAVGGTRADAPSSCDADRLRPEAALVLRPACVPSDHRRSARGALSRRLHPAPILDAVLPAALNPQPQLLSAPARTGHLKRRKMANVCDIRELRALPRLRPQQGSGTRGQGGVSSHV